MIELLISESFDPNDPNLYPHMFTYEARELVDDFGGEQCAAEIEARSIKCAGSSWAAGRLVVSSRPGVAAGLD